MVNLRMSQINGCVHCLRMHTRVALRAGDTPDRRGVLTDDQTAAVIWVAVTTNAFNRVSIMSGHPVRPER